MTDLGETFRATREQRGLTLEEVSARTKIPRRLLADLERNELARWPSHRIYRLGLIRAYAREVGLKNDEIIVRYLTALPDSAPGKRDTSSRRPSSLHPRRLLLLGAAAAVTAVSAMLAAAALRASPERAASPEPPAPPASVRPAQPSAPSVDPPVGSTDQARAAEPETEGELVIDSVPPGTWVVVNGIGRGITPVRVQYLPAGSYTVRLVREGYESVERTVSVGPERRRRTIRIVLQERPRPSR